MKTLFIFFLILFSCTHKKSNESYDPFERQEKELMSLNSVKEKIQIEIGLDTAGNSLFSRIINIRTYNKDGLIISSIRPQYKKREFKNTENLDVFEELKLLSSAMNETDIPIGINYTTYYTYNKDGYLIKEDIEEYGSNITVTYKYDKYGNKIEREVTPTLGQNYYQYMEYQYDKNGRIIFRKDSTNEMGMVKGRYYAPIINTSYYKYDEKGRIIYDGKYNRTFNAANQLIEISYGKDIIKNEKFTYDSNGNRTSRTIFTFYDLDQDLSKQQNNYDTKTYYYYNEKNLLIEEKTLDDKKYLIRLYNYEYTFY
ncbi:MAG: RHS repeat domain-containing protein [Dehalobacterium sp.]